MTSRTTDVICWTCFSVLPVERWKFSNFFNDFYFYYADELPEDALNNQDTDYFGAIHEKLDFVAPDEPDSESRRYGWISAKEFRNWLDEKLRDVPS